MDLFLTIYLNENQEEKKRRKINSHTLTTSTHNLTLISPTLKNLEFALATVEYFFHPKGYKLNFFPISLKKKITNVMNL